MEVKFGQGAQTAAQVDGPPAAKETLPAVQAPSAVGPARKTWILGDKIPDFSEIILPRINLVQNIGELKKTFSPGMLVLGRQTVLFTPAVIRDGIQDKQSSAPVTMTVLGFRPTRYSEKIQGGVQGLTVNTELEVQQAGGTLDYKEWELKKTSGMKLFQPLADAAVLVERPTSCIPRKTDAKGETVLDTAADDTIFTYEVQGKRYALALWAMKGTSYTEAAKRVFFTARFTGILKAGGYPSYSYAVTTREKAYPNGNLAWIPICVPNHRHSEEFLNFVKSVLAAPETEDQPS